MYEANVSMAFQFEDTGWDYLEEPLFNKSFETHEEAEEALCEYMRSDDLKDAADRLAKKHRDYVIAMEAEESITEDGYEFTQSDEGEYFDNTNVWTREDWEDFQ